LSTIREEVMAVIMKHVTVEADHVQVRMDRGAKVSKLEIEVEIPSALKAQFAIAS
jgi:cell division topological specificity factor